MSEENNKQIIINNYYYISPDNYFQFLDLFKTNPHNNNFLITQDKETPLDNSFLNKKRENHGNVQENNKNEKEIEDFTFGINDQKYNVEEKNINLDNTKDLTVEIEKPKKKFLFTIKQKTKVGRKPKFSKTISEHTKFSHDNILRKIKVKFFHKLVNYLNSIIISKYHTRLRPLKPLIGKINQNNSINFNKILLNTKLKDIFSLYEINGKFKLFEKNHNKSVIDKIYGENIKELIDILEMTFFEVFKIFRDLNDTQKLIGFEKIDSVIREMSDKESDENYIDKFRNAVMNFEKYYYDKIARK